MVDKILSEPAILSGLIGTLIGGMCAIGASLLTSIFSNRQIQQQLTCMQNEAEKQRQFEMMQSAKQFVLQQKISAYEFAIKTLPEFPRNVEMLRNAWAASALLKMYLPYEQKNLANNFDLKGVETKHIRGEQSSAPDFNFNQTQKWTKDYDDLCIILYKEIYILSNEL